MDVEIQRQLGFLRNLQNYLAESSANQRDFQKIIDIYQNPLHRILKLNCYPLLKTFPPSELLALELEKDLTNQDIEIQLSSLKLMICLPVTKIIQIIKSHDTSFYSIIESQAGFHYERLCAINSILILLLTKETEFDQQEMPKQSIYNIYRKMAENSFNQNRDISANCIQCLGETYQSSHQNLNNLINVNINLEIREYFIPRLLLLFERIQSFEVRMRSKLLIIIIKLLENLDSSIKIQSQINTQPNESLNIQQFNQDLISKIFYEMVNTCYEIDILFSCYSYALELFKRNQFEKYYLSNQFVWLYFQHLDQFIKNIGYKKELSQLIIEFLKLDLDINLNVTISIRVMEITSQVQNKLTRSLFMLYSFKNIIYCSNELILNKKSSAILGLYNQTWFLNQIKEDPEELIISMIIALVHSQIKSKQLYLEIFDICNSYIWEGCNLETILIYLVLVDECLNVIPQNELNLNDLIVRLNSSQIGFIQKVQTLLLLTKKYNEKTLYPKLEYTQILTEFRSFLIQPVTVAIQQVDMIQNIYKILYNLCANFHSGQNVLKQSILELLSDYNDNLLQRKNDDTAEKILQYNKQFVTYIQQNTSLDQVQLKLQKLNEGLQASNLETIQIAYNIFYKGTFILDQDKQISNLFDQNHSNNIFTNLQINSQLITGVSDFIQIYCSHAIDLSNGSICLGILIINNCPFQLNNLGIKILIDRNASIQNNMKTIDELPSFQKKELLFVVKANPQKSMHFAFEVALQDIKVDQQCFKIRTQNYRISLLEFLIPNNFIYLSQKCLDYAVQDSYVINCQLTVNYLILFKTLIKKPLASVLINHNKNVFRESIQRNFESIATNVEGNVDIYLQAYLPNGSTFGIQISNIHKNQEQQLITVEFKSKQVILNAITQEFDKLLQEISDGQIQTIHI